MPDPVATLIYDGDCGICGRWVAYWKLLTGDRIAYRPYQQAAADFPAISLDAFRHSIQLIEPDGTIYSGAAATFRVLRRAPGKGAWWWLYAHVPGFAPIAEWAYTFFARRRGLLNVLTRWLWGTTLEPPRYDLVRWWFLRGLGLVYLCAFASLSVQVLGLVGSGGILPLDAFLPAVRQNFGEGGWVLVPTLFWIDASDTALVVGTYVGIALALAVTFGVFVVPALAGAFVLYLSYCYAGQQFMSYQWDGLLLEAGFLAMFLPAGSRIVIWLYRLFLFRYLFMAGAAKLVSGDATWRSLTALSYHFETQPLPTPLAWYVAHLPAGALEFATAATLAVEVVLIFLVFTPRRPRMLAAWAVIVFQSLIILTGNYNFFNLLTILLTLFLFDDAALRRVLPSRLIARVTAATSQAGRGATRFAVLLALIVVPVGANRIGQLLLRHDLPLTDVVTRLVTPLMIVNGYGLFANMTTARPEIIVEGSADGTTWHAYDFRYKPGATARAPTWNIPHQPRLDWQMWFAALGDPREESWFVSFAERLLENKPDVVALLANNPFPDRPPQFVRATLYDYRFTDASTRATTGAWWVRRQEDEVLPPVSLADFARARGQ